METAEYRRVGFWIRSRASFLYSPKVVPFRATALKWGKTRSRTRGNISVGDASCPEFFRRSLPAGDQHQPH